MRDLLFAFVWMALLPLSLMSAHVGVLLWVWVALLSPNELLYGFLAGVPFNKIVALSTFVMMLVSREKKDFYLDATLVLLLCLAVSATISWSTGLVSGPDVDDLYQKLIKEVVLAVIITGVMTTRHRLNLLVFTIVASLAFLAVKEGLISILTAGGHKILGSGSIGDNNSLATALLMVIPLAIYLARHSAVRAVRTGWLVVAGLSVVTVVMTFSRGGFVGMLLLGAFYVKNSRNKLASLGLVALAGVLIYALAPDSWFDRLNTIKEAGDDGSFMGRVVAWKISWLIAMDHPLFGGGPHAVQHLLVWDTYKPLLASLDFIATPPPDSTPHAAHSIYFELLGDIGFVGLGIFLACVGVAIWNCRWIIRQTRNHPSLAWAADLARLSQISLVVYLVTGAALSMGYFELLYILVAMLSRARRIVGETLAAEAASSALDWATEWTGVSPEREAVPAFLPAPV